ncbi:hypothetical protein GGF31_002255 [Allomyces arbusculus]|nr:hypothetical protein GGF31_002255 [Allomyces arbusculus]
MTEARVAANAPVAAARAHARVPVAGAPRPTPTHRGRSRALSSSSSSSRRGTRDAAYWTDLVVTPARSLVVAWMVNTNARHADFRLHPDTLFSAVHYLDRLLNSPPTCLALPTLIHDPSTWARALYLSAAVSVVLAAKFLDEYQHPSVASVVAALKSAHEDMVAIARAAANRATPEVLPIVPGDVLRMERTVLEALEFRLMTGTWASPGACLQVWAAEHPLAVRGLWEGENDDGDTRTDRGSLGAEPAAAVATDRVGNASQAASPPTGVVAAAAPSTAVTTIATVTPPFTPAPESPSTSSSIPSTPVMAAPERWPAVLANSPARQHRLATFMATIHQWQTTLLLADANATRYPARDVAAALYRAATSPDAVVDEEEDDEGGADAAVRAAIAWWQRTAGPPRPRRNAAANHGTTTREIAAAHAVSTAAGVMRRPRRAASC